MTVLANESLSAAWFTKRDPALDSNYEAPELKAQRLSWAGTKLELASGTIFLDPWVNVDIWDGTWKEPIVPVESATSERNVIVTHPHNDHFDPVAIRKLLAERGRVICHEDIAATVASRGFRVRALKLYEPLLQGDFTITAVPAVDGTNDGQVSWVVAGGGRKIIHCGDTLWHGAWWHIGRQHGPFDAAFLPINGAQLLSRKPPSGIPASLTPEQAVAAAIILGARLAIPIHYGLPPSSSYVEIPSAETAFIEAARKRGLDVEIVKPGEWLKWKANK
jgi:L-ascorbate metabolism protein UlaG (beta-lactamase superfamily)